MAGRIGRLGLLTAEVLAAKTMTVFRNNTAVPFALPDDPASRQERRLSWDGAAGLFPGAYHLSGQQSGRPLSEGSSESYATILSAEWRCHWHALSTAACWNSRRDFLKMWSADRLSKLSRAMGQWGELALDEENPMLRSQSGQTKASIAPE